MRAARGARFRSSFATLLALSLAITWTMGVRTPRVKAFSTGSYSGVGRVELRLEPLNHAGDTLDVMAGMTFATGLSTFGQGLLVRSSFRVPKTGETVTLVMDFDRSGGRKSWTAGEPTFKAELATLRDGKPRIETVAVEGGATLEAAFVRKGVVGFRLVGLIEVVEAGRDGVIGTADDLRTEVDFVLESTPTAEDVAGAGVVVDPCAKGDCWVDQGPNDVGCTGHDDSDDYHEHYDHEPVGCSDRDDDDSSGGGDWWSDDDDDDDDWWSDDGVDDNGNSSDDGLDDNGNPK